ncbi:hypothetical protein VTK26DRAFT_6410 [Humicola hyalothermophila]
MAAGRNGSMAQLQYIHSWYLSCAPVGISIPFRTQAELILSEADQYFVKYPWPWARHQQDPRALTNQWQDGGESKQNRAEFWPAEVRGRRQAKNAIQRAPTMR